MFVCGGENVYPGDVEGTLERHPDVLQAAVLPVDHKLKGQVPVAFVVARPGSGLSEQGVKEWALAHGPAYQHPRRVFLVPELPLAGAYVLPPFQDLDGVKLGFLWVAVAFTLISGIDIVRRGWREAAVAS